MSWHWYVIIALLMASTALGFKAAMQGKDLAAATTRQAQLESGMRLLASQVKAAELAMCERQAAYEEAANVQGIRIALFESVDKNWCDTSLPDSVVRMFDVGTARDGGDDLALGNSLAGNAGPQLDAAHPGGDR